MTREQALNYMRSSGWSEEQIDTVVSALVSSPENPNKSEIKQKCDRINSLASVLPYAPHREIQELLCEIMDMFSVSTEKTGRCKDCQYFQHDSIAIVDGIPLIVAHEICTTWGDGCKTREDGYCFMYTPKVESEDKV